MTIVETSSGKVEGAARGRHLSFLGIPYAAAPSGARRFRAPEPPTPWGGVRPALEPGFASPQSSHPIPGFAASGPQDEDCLFLNVFTPAADGAGRPVLFWIHGGGFTHGAATEALYNGGPLAERGDVVVVTINYRLGALGYLYLGAHLPTAGLTANAGQLDQVAALHWVAENITAFGGDPGNVTIFGESAGAAAVGTLLAMPAAAGLFQRAILQSGTGRAAGPEQAAKVTEMLLAELGIAGDPGGILTIDAGRIVEAQSAVVARARELGLLFGPVRDEATVPESPIEAIRAGRAAAGPVLVGTNRDEVKLFAAMMRRDEPGGTALLNAVRPSVPGASDGDVAALIDTYRQSRRARALPESNLDMLDAIRSDAGFRIPATRFALAQGERQPRTFVYLFTYASPSRRGSLGACHALEMPFVFGTLSAPTQDRFAGSGPAVEALSTTMMDAWIAFARTGEPGADWDAYEATRRSTMVFDVDSRMQSDPFGEERAALERLMAEPALAR